MFTGIVESQGRIKSLSRTARGATLVIDTALDLSDSAVGDSIAVDGCCLTATRLAKHSFTAEMSNETLARTSLGGRRVGHPVNLERALKLGDRLGGHMVQGHVDGTGVLRRIVDNGDGWDYHVGGLSADLVDQLVEKGSVTMDGVSLTINGVTADGFHVTLIPHTRLITTLGARQIGDTVNIETDIVGKYIVSLARRGRLTANAGLTLQKLEEHGFK